jgi:hypothetical protein
VIKRQGLTAVLIAVAVSVGGSSTGMAQGTPQFTKANVTKEQPFGTLGVDTGKATEKEIAPFLASLNTAQKAELAGRCAVITAPENVTFYTNAAFAWCNVYGKVIITTK